MADDPNNPPVDDPEKDDPELDDPDDDDPDDDPTKKPNEDVERLKRTLRRLRTERANLRKQVAEATKTKDQPATEDPAVKAENRARRQGGITALVEAGLTKAAAKKAVRMLDLSGVDLDEDGEGDFEDAVADLKEDFPELFKSADTRQTSRQSVRPPAGGTTRVRSTEKVDPTTLALLRQAGYR